MRRIRDALIARPWRVVWLIAAYFLIAVVVRVARTEGLQNDEAEQLFLSQFLLWGYGRQPPFYNWLQYGVVQLVGPSILALTLLKNGLLFMTCLFYGLAARRVSGDRTIVAASMLAVLALPAVTILAQRDLSHAVATLFAVSFFLWAFLGALTRPSLWRYALTGLAIGIGAIAKYNFVVLPVAAILAILPEPDLRRRLFDWRLSATVAVAVLVCLPHALWLLENMQAATAGTVNAMRDDATGSGLADRLSGFLDLAGSTVSGAILLVIFLLLAFRAGRRQTWRAETLWTRVIGRMFIACLLIVALIALGMGATTVSQKWLSPFLLLLPLYLCLKIGAAGGGGSADRDGVARLALPISVLAFGFLIYLTAGNLIAPLFGHYQKDSLPSVPFVRQVLAQAAPTSEPRFIVAGSMALAGSARIAAPTTPVFLPSFSLSPLALPQQARGLAVWPATDGPALTEPLKAYLVGEGIDPAELKPQTVEVGYPLSRGRKTASFSYAWIGPQ